MHLTGCQSRIPGLWLGNYSDHQAVLVGCAGVLSQFAKVRVVRIGFKDEAVAPCP